ncbi:MAG: YebC/PmpR family DNA-binding transcriptional regulator [Bacilli bacterium]|jgi:YebC/PmpR family DNA-binding regulatory protein|nr:YebC/PmpR family DNA-binding transcriptional regulator [Bacilli bacterium]
MGRAYEVRKASIQKTGAAKAKLYSTYAKEIYLAAKKGIPEIESNVLLKRLVEKAKKEQVPNDIIHRAIEKAKGAGGEDYETVIYEGFGPGASTLIIKTLTDNVNRTVGFVRAAFNKVHKSLGVTNSVSYNYDYLAHISFNYEESEKIFEELLNAGIDLIDFDEEDGSIFITVRPNDHNKVKDVIEHIIPNVNYELDEEGMYPKDKVKLEEEDLETFQKLYKMLDEIEDVTEIFHNVELDLDEIA